MLMEEHGQGESSVTVNSGSGESELASQATGHCLNKDLGLKG